MSQVKKEWDEDFDLPLGCHNSAEVCELQDPIILNLLQYF